MHRFFKIFLYQMVVLFSNKAVAQGKQITEQIIVDGMQRKIVTYLPVNSSSEVMPVVIALHGGFATPKAMFRLADFKSLADKERFIVVCPASRRFWHDGADTKGIDDVKFIEVLISHLIKNYHADATRIYVTGISNGGFMATRLACQLPGKIAAVAVVAATLDKNEGYEPQKPMPIMYIHGTSDPIVMYEGGKLFGRSIYSHREVIEKWVAVNQCYPEPDTAYIPDAGKNNTGIFKQEYTNRQNGIKVISYTVENGGHTWPNGRQYFPEFIIGKTPRNMDACKVIWDFFKTYSKQIE